MESKLSGLQILILPCNRIANPIEHVEHFPIVPTDLQSGGYEYEDL